MSDFDHPDLDRDYWQNRYEERLTGWDMGGVSPPIAAYFEQVPDRQARILIPGAGNAHEAEHLFRLGFQNVHVLDIARAPLEAFRRRCPDFPSQNLHHEDFFDHSGQYDLIVEQTFFCAIGPELRMHYVLRTLELLAPGGKLVGLLFNHPMHGGPPFGGTLAEYESLFLPLFEAYAGEAFALCDNSISPRAGREFFMRLRKPV